MGYFLKTESFLPSPFQMGLRSPKTVSPYTEPLHGCTGVRGHGRRQRGSVCVCVCVHVPMLRETYSLGMGCAWGAHGRIYVAVIDFKLRLIWTSHPLLGSIILPRVLGCACGVEGYGKNLMETVRAKSLFPPPPPSWGCSLGKSPGHPG